MIYLCFLGIHCRHAGRGCPFVVYVGTNFSILCCHWRIFILMKGHDIVIKRDLLLIPYLFYNYYSNTDNIVKDTLIDPIGDICAY